MGKELISLVGSKGTNFFPTPPIPTISLVFSLSLSSSCQNFWLKQKVLRFEFIPVLVFFFLLSGVVY